MELVLPVLVFIGLMGVFATGATWKWADTQRRAQAELQRLTDRIGAEVTHRFQHVVYGLRSTSGFLESGLVGDARAFKAMATSLGLGDQFPGILSLGLVRLAPRETGSARTGDLTLAYLEPEDGHQPLLMAMTSEPAFLATAYRTASKGTAQMTGSLPATRGLRGLPIVFVFVPVTNAQLAGNLVVAQLDIQKLLAGMPDNASGLLELVVQETTATEAAPVKLRVTPTPPIPPAYLTDSSGERPYVSSLTLPILEREYRLLGRSTPKFNALFTDRSPWFVLGTGILISAMLALVLRNRLTRHLTLSDMVARRTRELEHERLRLRTILETATDGIHILNTEGLLVEANPAFLRMLRMNAAAIGQAHVADWDVGGRAISSDMLKDVSKAATGSVIETRHRVCGGGVIEVEVNVCGLTIDGQELLYCASRDVTERNRVKAALQRSEEFKKGILDSISDAIVVVNNAGIVVAGNLAWRKACELDALASEDQASEAAAPLGSPYRLACRAATAVANADLGIGAVLAGRRAGYSLRYQCTQAGRQRWLRLSVTALVHGGRRHAVIMHQDITQQRHLEQERIKAQALLQNVSNRVPGMLYEYRLQPDGSSSFSFASEGIQELYEVSPQQAKADARAVFEAILPQDRDAVLASLRQSGYELTPRVHEYRVLHADGQVRWLMDNSLAQIGADGKTLWHGFVTDVTERKRAEMELISYQTRLQDMVNDGVQQVQSLSMELASAEARERRELSQDLHDNLGQGLALIRFRLKSLTARDDGSDEAGEQQQLREISTLVEHAIQSVRTLTAQLWPPVLYRFGLGPALEWLAAEMESHYGLSVTLRIEPHERLDEVTGIFLFRAARELLINVWKHAQVSRAELSLAVDPVDQTLRLRISDQGVGFDAERAHDPQANRFGLFSLSERIKLIGGRVQIESQMGVGTTVTISLKPGAHRS